MLIHPARIVAIVLIVLILFGGAIVLQVFLSKKPSKWLGLILPAISLLLSIAQVINRAVNGRVERGVLAYLLIFLIANIPTGIYLAIYASGRESVKKKSQIDKMNIQDL